MNARRLLIAYALGNAVLYSVLLPLWEGFDEPFHFAYVQQLANGQGLPDPRTARLSSEVGASILLAPASQVVKQNLPQVTSYAQYFSWPAERRAEVRRQLREIPVDLRRQPSQFMNYEAHHPPLAYLLLALPERLLAHVALPIRVAVLRMIAAVAGCLLLLGGAKRLFSQLGIRDSYNAVALFCLFSCQMTWATLAHVGNDWLAVPIAAFTLVALNRYDASPSLRAIAVTAIILALGLLTKAYFLAFMPLLLGSVRVPKTLAGSRDCICYPLRVGRPLVRSESRTVRRPHWNTGVAGWRGFACCYEGGANGELVSSNPVECPIRTLDRQQQFLDVLGKHIEPVDRHRLDGVAALGCESPCEH